MILAYGYVSDIISNADGKNKSAAESEAGRRLLDLLLERVGIDASALEVKPDQNGKPSFVGRDDLHFNISHTNGFAVCALSAGEGRVGVDAEPQKSAIPRERQVRIAERFFSENEKKALADGESFVSLWTKREAYLKMTGEGIARAARSDIPESVWFYSLNKEGCVITLCTESRVKVEACEYKDLL